MTFTGFPTGLKDLGWDSEGPTWEPVGFSGFVFETPAWDWLASIQEQQSESGMNHKAFALGALSALALSAQAQVYNWTLTSPDPSLGNGSGQLTLTSGVVTAMSGMIGGQSGTLMAPGVYGPNQLWYVNNRIETFSALGFLLPGRTYSGIYFNPGDFVDGIPPFVQWFDGNLGGSTVPVNAFSVTPVPEPSTWAMGVVFGVGAMVTVGMRRRQAAKV